MKSPKGVKVREENKDTRTSSLRHFKVNSREKTEAMRQPEKEQSVAWKEDQDRKTRRKESPLAPTRRDPRTDLGIQHCALSQIISFPLPVSPHVRPDIY